MSSRYIQLCRLVGRSVSLFICSNKKEFWSRGTLNSRGENLTIRCFIHEPHGEYDRKAKGLLFVQELPFLTEFGKRRVSWPYTSHLRNTQCHTLVRVDKRPISCPRSYQMSNQMRFSKSDKKFKWNIGWRSPHLYTIRFENTLRLVKSSSTDFTILSIT